ncbi:hypothetical protein EK21DRAFT_94598 [Setomelanomma holmii]|uniref:Uncharacterized protein n=1 Tax=Setomelanomma holmii TaxID=210430 RepID=A0A9P4GXK3_9PLEO|nr:hypothetical protein EK21DRAFT_94598 [Setomelanomma holmii]
MAHKAVIQSWKKDDIPNFIRAGIEDPACGARLDILTMIWAHRNASSVDLPSLLASSKKDPPHVFNRIQSLVQIGQAKAEWDAHKIQRSCILGIIKDRKATRKSFAALEDYLQNIESINRAYGELDALLLCGTPESPVSLCNRKGQLRALLRVLDFESGHINHSKTHSDAQRSPEQCGDHGLAPQSDRKPYQKKVGDTTEVTTTEESAQTVHLQNSSGNSALQDVVYRKGSQTPTQFQVARNSPTGHHATQCAPLKEPFTPHDMMAETNEAQFTVNQSVHPSKRPLHHTEGHRNDQHHLVATTAAVTYARQDPSSKRPRRQSMEGQGAGDRMSAEDARSFTVLSQWPCGPDAQLPLHKLIPDHGSFSTDESERFHYKGQVSLPGTSDRLVTYTWSGYHACVTLGKSEIA